ncbi:MAG: T9SS type A sorting domain-containing protein [Flavobacteriales bacterium]|nr:T9SS type A sorting domain-containing protein [Flavobacteriales bacterium]MCB9449084.1 T9SS type A sorting domain-containing protein [Flavobacteriales bacterium]
MKHILLSGFLLASTWACATHNKGGEISYKHLSGRTYEVEVVTFTHTLSQADRDSLYIEVAEDTSLNKWAKRINGPDTDPANGIPDGESIGCSQTKKNIYLFQCTFPHDGTYHISMVDPNRNAGIVNIPVSVDVPFCIDAEIHVNSSQPNSSPRFLSDPIYFAELNIPCTLNATAFDDEGDSLVFALDTCLELFGSPVSGYTIPAGVSQNPINGEFVWNLPTLKGEYAFRVKISEWRDGVFLGYTSRDFNVNVQESYFSDFVFDSLATWPKNSNGDYEIHVAPNNPVQLPISYENKSVWVPDILGIGDVFSMPNAAQLNLTTTTTSVSGLFTWTPGTNDFRSQPYVVTFRGASVYSNNSQCLYHDLTLMIYVDIPAGINDAGTSDNTMQLFPNPFSYHTTLKLNERLVALKPVLYVRDALGRIVHRQEIHSTETVIAPKGVGPGIYYYAITTADPNVQKTGKVVIQ